MAYSHQIFPEQNLTLICASGSVSGRDILASMDEMFGDPDWRLGMTQLNDYRDITEFVITPEDLRAILARETQMARRQERPVRAGRLAIVVRSDLYEEVCRLYAALEKKRSFDVEVFRSLEQAAAWLDLSPEQRRMVPGEEGRPDAPCN